MDKPIRTLTRGAYDLQKLRIQTGNRVVGNFRAKLGQAPGERAADVLDDDAKQFLLDLKRRHRRITDAIIADRHKSPGAEKRAALPETPTGLKRANIRQTPEKEERAESQETPVKDQRAVTDETPSAPKRFPGDEVISTYTEYALVSQYVELEQVEKDHFKRLGVVLKDIPIFTEFLSGVRGIGPAMAGVIISEFDIHKAKYPSSLWAYAGLDLGPDGQGRSKRKEHLIKRQYKTAKGEDSERDSITYNPWLKTKLMGVLAASFLRSGSPYAEYYKNYRHRIESDPTRVMKDKPGYSKENEWSKMRRHQAALRYMIKMFLLDLYKAWRPLEGLEVSPPYSEAKQGHIHRAA